MSTLRVTITADGVSRAFDGVGDGPELVAAFRAWLAGPDGALAIAEGADTLERVATEVEASADDLDDMDVPAVKRWLLSFVRDRKTVESEELFRGVQVMGVSRARFKAALSDLLDAGQVFARRVDDGDLAISSEAPRP